MCHIHVDSEESREREKAKRIAALRNLERREIEVKA